MDPWTWSRWWWATVMVFGLVAGCDSGPERFPVSGQVVINGRPLTSGTILGAPSDDRPAYGEIDAQGRFTLTTYKDSDGCVAGTHPVTVTAIEMISRKRCGILFRTGTRYSPRRT